MERKEIEALGFNTGDPIKVEFIDGSFAVGTYKRCTGCGGKPKIVIDGKSYDLRGVKNIVRV